MTRRPARLIPDPPPGLRERPRADGSVRIWWEPSTEARAQGAKPVELSADRLTWSVRRAKELNRDAARGPRAPAVGQTMNHLIDDFETSKGYRQLRAATQANMRAHFRRIRAKWGSDLVADFTKPVLARWYETLDAEHGPAMALALIRSMSRLFSHAELRGWRAERSNPCHKIGMTVPKGRRRNSGWAQLDVLIATADKLGHPAIGDAIILSMLQGQRQTDVIGARRENFHQHVLPGPKRKGAVPRTAWIWALEQSKRGQMAVAALHPETVARLAARLAQTATGPLLVDDVTGRPWTADHFGKRFRMVRDAAVAAGHLDLQGLQFRDLRRTFGALGRAGGATKADLADVLGNSAATDQFLADVYMAPQIATVLRVVEAIARPEKETRKRA